MASPEVSIIIPTFDEATYVNRLLDALKFQSFKDFEVIISDADSNDGIADVVKDYKKHFELKLIENPPKGPGVGRNQGAKLAHGDWLLFLDADVDIDDKNFISTLLSVAKQNGWSTVSARARINGGSTAERIGSLFHHFYIRLLSHTKHPVANGYCLLTKKDVFKNANGFDKDLMQGEDFDYVTRTAKFGFGFVDTTYYYVDLRRYRGHNALIEILKMPYFEFNRFTHGYKIKNPRFKPTFGQHKKREQ